MGGCFVACIVQSPAVRIPTEGIDTASQDRVRGLSLILVASRWPANTWHSSIMTMLFKDTDVSFSLRNDLLSQAGGRLYFLGWNCGFWGLPIERENLIDLFDLTRMPAMGRLLG